MKQYYTRRLRNGVFGFHDLSRRVFQSGAISAGGLALSVCVMRLLGFVCLIPIPGNSDSARIPKSVIL